jgi:hypothetical protein
MVDSSAVAPNGNVATSRYFAVTVLGGILFACAAQAAHWQPIRYGDDSLAAALTPHVAAPADPARVNLRARPLSSAAKTQDLGDVWPELRHRHWDNRLDVERIGSTINRHSARSSFPIDRLGLDINKDIEPNYVARFEHDQDSRVQTDNEQSVWNSALSDTTELYVPPEFSYHPIVKNKTCRASLRCGAAFYSDTRPDVYKKRNEHAFERKGLVADRGTRD